MDTSESSVYEYCAKCDIRTDSKYCPKCGKHTVFVGKVLHNKTGTEWKDNGD